MTAQNLSADFKLLTAKQAAVKLESTEGTLGFWRHKGRGPNYVKCGKFIRYRIEDLDQWVKERMIETSSDQNKGAR